MTHFNLEEEMFLHELANDLKTIEIKKIQKDIRDHDLDSTLTYEYKSQPKERLTMSVKKWLLWTVYELENRKESKKYILLQLI